MIAKSGECIGRLTGFRRQCFVAQEVGVLHGTGRRETRD